MGGEREALNIGAVRQPRFNSQTRVLLHVGATKHIHTRILLDVGATKDAHTR